MTSLFRGLQRVAPLRARMPRYSAAADRVWPDGPCPCPKKCVPRGWLVSEGQRGEQEGVLPARAEMARREPRNDRTEEALPCILHRHARRAQTGGRTAGQFAFVAATPTPVAPTGADAPEWQVAFKPPTRQSRQSLPLRARMSRTRTHSRGHSQSRAPPAARMSRSGRGGAFSWIPACPCAPASADVPLVTA